jgi:hypothetical protein
MLTGWATFLLKRINTAMSDARPYCCHRLMIIKRTPHHKLFLKSPPCKKKEIVIDTTRAIIFCVLLRYDICDFKKMATDNEKHYTSNRNVQNLIVLIEN